MDKKVEQYYLSKVPEHFQEICLRLRDLIMISDPEIVECLKWQMPHYDYNGLMMGVAGFKKHVTLFFHRGAEMKDPSGFFTGQEENKTMRTVQFKSVDEIDDELILSYIQEALRISKSGKAKMPKPKKEPVVVPKVLQDLLNQNFKAKETFDDWSNSKRKAYVHWIESAKTEATLNKRLNEAIEHMNAGVHKDDKYRKKK